MRRLRRQLVATAALTMQVLGGLPIALPIATAAEAALPPCASTQRVQLDGQHDWRCLLDVTTRHSYLLRIDDQRVDVAMELVDADDAARLRVDSPTRRDGPELLWLLSDRSQRQTLIVSAQDRDASSVALDLQIAIAPSSTPGTARESGLASLTMSATVSATTDRKDTERRMSLLRDAVRQFQTAGDLALAAEAEFRIGHLYYWSLGDWRQAADSAQRSNQLFARVQQPIMAAHAAALRAASMIEIAREPPKADARSAPGSRTLDSYEARRLLSEAARTFHDARRPYDEAHAINNIGLSFLYQGMADEARAQFEQAARLFAAAGESSSELLPLENIATLEYERGNYVAAAASYAALRTRMDPERDVGAYVTLLNNLAIAAYASGQLDVALDALLTALPLTEHDVDPSHRARTLHALGRVYLIAGDTERATVFLRQALELRRLESTHDRRGLLTSLIRNGDLQRDDGNVPAALKLHLEAFDHAVSTSEKARVLLAIGTDQRLSGSLDAAQSTFERALALGLDDEWPVRASLMGGLGQARMLDSDASGRELVLNAAAAHRAAGDGELAAQNYSFLAEQDYRARRFDSALNFIDRAIALYGAQGPGVINPDLRATYIASRADSYDLQASIYMSLREAATNSDEKQRWGFAALASMESLRLSALDDFRRLNAGHAAGESSSAAETVSTLDAQIAAKRHRLDTVLDQQNPSAERVTALRRDLALLRSQLDAAQVSRARPQETRVRQRDPVSVAQLQSSVAPDTALVSWQLGAERSWAWCITRERIDAFELGSRNDIDATARQLYASWSSPGANVDEESERKLSRRLLGDASACLQAKRSIVVVPDGALRSIPFSALWLEDGRGQARRVIETHATVYRPSLTAWRADSVAEAQSAGGRSILLVGDPVLPTDTHAAASYAYRNLRPLPGAAREMTEIAAMATGWQAVSLARERATRDAVLAQPLDDFRVIHFATHALLDVHDPQLSALVLSGASSLTLRDVMNLELRTDTVVLGACEGSLGKQYRGQLSLGLSEAFLFAGANNVLGSLWPVSDTATARYMRAFYEQYLHGGVEPQAVARTVALGMMRDARYRHPFYWAAFVDLSP